MRGRGGGRRGRVERRAALRGGERGDDRRAALRSGERGAGQCAPVRGGERGGDLRAAVRGGERGAGRRAAVRGEDRRIGERGHPPAGARRADPDAAEAARTLDQVATLVGAGLPPSRAWALVGGRPRCDAPASRDVAAVLRVAERTGAPSVPALYALARALRRSAASDRAVRVALAGPRASARVVLALPALGLALGTAWGAGAVEVLVRTPVGWGCCVVAAGLVWAGRAWSARLVRAATPDGRLPGVLLDAWAVAVSGGGSWSDAGRAVREAFAETESPTGQRGPGEPGVPGAPGGLGSPGGPGGPGGLSALGGLGSSGGPGVGPSSRDPSADARLREVLALAARAGVPAAALLRAAAEDVRDDAAAAGLAAAERLAVRLVLPLGVCVLPAFVLVGVVPVVVGVLSSTVGGLG